MKNHLDGDIAKLPTTHTQATQEQEPTFNYRKSIATLNRILEKEMHNLEKMQSSQPQNKDDQSEWQEEWNKKFGAKETILSAGIKITSTLHKLMVMDNKEIAATKTVAAKTCNANNISESDIPGDVMDGIREKCKKDMIANGYRPTAPTSALTPLNTQVPQLMLKDGILCAAPVQKSFNLNY